MSPVLGVDYVLRDEVAGARTIALEAVADCDAHTLHWFADEAYLGRSGSGEPFFWEADAGTFLLRVVDAQGRSASREISIVMGD